MVSVISFFRKVPANSLRDYFAKLDPPLANSPDWRAQETEFQAALKLYFEGLAPEIQSQIELDIDQVSAMSDEAGQAALRGLLGNERMFFEEMEHGPERALWVLVNSPKVFRRAEESRHTDERRRGRSWSGFVCEPGLALRRDESSIKAFTEALKKHYETDKIHVDIYERTRPTYGG